MPTRGLRSHAPTLQPLLGPGDAPEVYALTRMAKEVAQTMSLEGWAKVGPRHEFEGQAKQKARPGTIPADRYPEVAPRGQGEILIEELHRAIAAIKENDVELTAAATRSPFNLEIREARLPKGSNF